MEITAAGIIAIVRLAADVANVSMLYLLAVLASAVLFGSRAAIISALAAFLAFNFFFIHPEFTFTVADEDQRGSAGTSAGDRHRHGTARSLPARQGA